MSVEQLTRRDLKVVLEAELVEASAGTSPVAADGTVQIHLIRPCVGRGKGRHVYEADMLRKHAESGHFVDWPMYIDHESPAARKAAGGLPRSLNDLGGRVIEHWWDESVPAAGRFGQGAVVAKVRPVPFVRDLIEHDAKLVQASINTHATGISGHKRIGGQLHPVIEGFEHEGSVDWVTRAGAGGRVVQLLEADTADTLGMDDAELHELLEALPGDRLGHFIREHRPEVAEHLSEEDDDVKPEEVTALVLEALRSDEGKAAIQEAAGTDDDAITAKVTESIADVLPDAIGAATGVIEEGARAIVRHETRMSTLRSKAETAIAEAKLEDGSALPAKFQAKALTSLTSILEAGLDDKTDDDGKVTETAEAQFDAIVEAELKDQRELVESVRPTPAGGRRRAAAPPARTTVTENGTGGDPKDSPEPVLEAEVEEEGEKQPYRIGLQEAGVDVHAAYGVPKPTPVGA